MTQPSAKRISSTRKFCQEHAGEIWVWSEASGKFRAHRLSELPGHEFDRFVGLFASRGAPGEWLFRGVKG